MLTRQLHTHTRHNPETDRINAETTSKQSPACWDAERASKMWTAALARLLVLASGILVSAQLLAAHGENRSAERHGTMRRVAPALQVAVPR